MTWRTDFQPINADTLDGHDSTYFSPVNHTHNYIAKVPVSAGTTTSYIVDSTTVARETAPLRKLITEEVFIYTGSEFLWSPDPSATMLEYTAIGGGGGGGTYNCTVQGSGTATGGGGAGGCASYGILYDGLDSIDFSSLYMYVGNGGLGSSNININGTAGEDTYISTVISAGNIVIRAEGGPYGRQALNPSGGNVSSNVGNFPTNCSGAYYSGTSLAINGLTVQGTTGTSGLASDCYVPGTPKNSTMFAIGGSGGDSALGFGTGRNGRVGYCNYYGGYSTSNYHTYGASGNGYGAGGSGVATSRVLSQYTEYYAGDGTPGILIIRSYT